MNDILGIINFSKNYTSEQLNTIFNRCDNPTLVRMLFDAHAYKNGYVVEYGFIKWFENISIKNQEKVYEYLSDIIW